MPLKRGEEQRQVPDRSGAAWREESCSGVAISGVRMIAPFPGGLNRAF